MTMHAEDDASALPFGGVTDSISINEGVIITEVGPNAELLKAMGLKPTVGDVVYSVDDDVVTHLNTHQLKRLVWRKYKEAKTQYSALGTKYSTEDVDDDNDDDNDDEDDDDDDDDALHCNGCWFVVFIVL